MVAVEVFVTIVALAVLGLLLVAGIAWLLGKRLHLDDWYRRDRQRLEAHRRHEQATEEARTEALKELESPKEASQQQIIEPRNHEEK